MSTNQTSRRPKCKLNSGWLIYHGVTICVCCSGHPGITLGEQYLRHSELGKQWKKTHTLFLLELFLQRQWEVETFTCVHIQAFCFYHDIPGRMHAGLTGKKDSLSQPVVWQEVQIDSFVGSVRRSLGIHQQYAIHLSKHLCTGCQRAKLITWPRLVRNMSGHGVWGLPILQKEQGRCCTLGV